MKKTILALWLIVCVAFSLKAAFTNVVVKSPGTLEQLLSNLSFEELRKIAIKGALNTEDLKYLSTFDGKVKDIEELDLRSVTLIPGDECYKVIVRSNSSGVWSERVYCYISDTNKEVDGSEEWLGTISHTPRIFGNCFAGVFAGNKRIKVVYFPDYMTEIGGYAFYNSSINNVEINSNITRIGTFAFGYSTLSSIDLPSSVTDIATYAFCLATNLEKINAVLPNVESVGAYAFEETKFPELALPSLKTLTQGAFYHSGIKSFKIPDKIKTLEQEVFCGCSELSDIDIPASIDSIGEWALSGTQWLKNHPGENGVVYVNNVAYSFSNNVSDYKEIHFKEGTTHIAANFFMNTYRGNSFKKPKVGIFMPPSVKYICKNAFYNSNSNIILQLSLDNLDLGSVEYIEENGINAVPSESMSRIELPATLKELGWHKGIGIDTLIFRCQNLKLTSTPMNIYPTTIIIGSEVEKIPPSAFEEVWTIRNIIFEDRSEDEDLIIGDRAFYMYGENTNTRIERTVYNFPKNVSYIGYDNFRANCTTNKNYTVHFDKPVDLSNTKEIGREAFAGSTGAFVGDTFVLPRNLKVINSGALSGYDNIHHVIVECDSLKWAPGIFNNKNDDYYDKYDPNYNIKSVYIRKNVKHIPEGMFWSCPNLETITFEERNPDNYTELTIYGNVCGSNRLYDIAIDAMCEEPSKVTEIELPYGTIWAAANAFDQSLKRLIIPKTFKQFWSYYRIKTKDLKIECYAPTPPNDFYFMNPDKSMIVSVPEQYIETYENDYFWSQATLVPIIGYDSESNIETQTIDFDISGNTLYISGADNSAVDIYNLSGRKIYSNKAYNGESITLSSGIYIIKIGNKVYKQAVY